MGHRPRASLARPWIDVLARPIRPLRGLHPPLRGIGHRSGARFAALRIGVLALTLLAACPDVHVVPPPEDRPAAATPPPAVAAWLACTAQLGFELRLADVLAPDRIAIALRAPAIHAIAAGDPGDPDLRALRWLTPIPAGGWDLEVRVGPSGALTLEAFAPGAFLDAQRLLVVAGRCGALAPGVAIAQVWSGGPPEAVTTRGAARLVIAACGAGPRCPDGWRERLLQLAAVHADAAPPRFERDCDAARPPDPGRSAARDLRAWVLDEIGPPPDGSVVAWAAALSAHALGGGEGVIRPRFAALLAAGDATAAARLVDEAVAAELDVSERLRFEAALAWQAGGDLAAARDRLTRLADSGRTAYADFARHELRSLPR